MDAPQSTKMFNRNKKVHFVIKHCYSGVVNIGTRETETVNMNKRVALPPGNDVSATAFCQNIWYTNSHFCCSVKI